METIFALVTVLQTMSVSLGVGSSTFAILNFFVAVWDDNIDATERKMMGIVYIVLRVAMVLIFLTTIIQGLIVYNLVGANYFSPLIISIWAIIIILFLNAALMTLHKIPMTLAAGLQAGSWYSLGFITAMISVGWNRFELWEYAVLYVAMVALMVGIVNGFLYYKNKKTSARNRYFGIKQR